MRTLREFMDDLLPVADLKRRVSLTDVEIIARRGVMAEEAPVFGSHAGPANQANARVYPDGSPYVPKDSGFKLGSKSKAELVGVLPAMVEVAELALRLSTQDFMIFDGLRTPEEQKTLVAKGMSKTLNSKHMEQGDGFSHAFDAVPVVGTIPKWDWELIWPVAYAVDQAATKLGCAHRIRWGGAWDRTLADFGGDANAYERETELYASRHPGKDFLDGPHFEWIS